VYLKAIEAERRIKETEELETRLAELEHQQGGLRWGT
jgi:ribosomal protein L29